MGTLEGVIGGPLGGGTAREEASLKPLSDGAGAELGERGDGIGVEDGGQEAGDPDGEMGGGGEPAGFSGEQAGEQHEEGDVHEIEGVGEGGAGAGGAGEDAGAGGGGSTKKHVEVQRGRRGRG